MNPGFSFRGGLLYRLANACVDWINAFLDTIIEYYRNDIREYKHFSEDVIRFTLRNATNYLALNNYEKLIEIATLYWIEKDNSLYYYDTYFNRSNEYGLNKNADNYHFEFKTAEDNMFFCCMIKSKFNYTLEWTINFINEAMAYYFKDDRLDEYKITLFFVEENKVREYYASDQFWLMGIQDYSGHELLSDFIYLLKRMIILNLEAHKDDRIIFEQFANHVKTILYSKSNNIALLTIIEEIGLHFSNELPGYALDLVSSIEMLLCDNSRFILYIPICTNL